MWISWGLLRNRHKSQITYRNVEKVSDFQKNKHQTMARIWKELKTLKNLF